MYYYYYYYCVVVVVVVVVIVVVIVSCHVPFLPGISLAPTVIPTTQASCFRLSIVCFMCDVPSIAVFCGESIECFPGTASKFFLKPFVSFPVAPVFTGIILYFRFHIHCILI